MIVLVPDGQPETKLPVQVWRSVLRLARTYDKEIRVVCQKDDRPDLAVTELEMIHDQTAAATAMTTARAVIGTPGSWPAKTQRAVVMVPEGKENRFRYGGTANVLVYRPGDVQMTSGILIGLRRLMAAI